MFFQAMNACPSGFNLDFKRCIVYLPHMQSTKGMIRHALCIELTRGTIEADISTLLVVLRCHDQLYFVHFSFVFLFVSPKV